jgi:Acetyltransferase (GNAT) family
MSIAHEAIALSTATIKNFEDFTPETVSAAISAINATRGWSKYDASVISYILSNTSSSVFAEHDGKIIGYALFKPEKEMLSYIAVDPASGVKHTGFKLMDATVEKVKSLVIKHLKWEYRGVESGPGLFYEKFLTTRGLSFERKVVGEYLNKDPKVEISIDLST